MDTGAAPSCISVGLFRKLLRHSRTHVPMEMTNYTTYNFVGEKSSVVGQVTLDVTARSTNEQKICFHNVPFLITPEVDERLILGQNLLKSLGATIGYADKNHMYMEFDEPPCRILSEAVSLDQSDDENDGDVYGLN